MIRNLSYTGCRVEYFKQVSPSGRVLLKEPSLPLELWANVVWHADGVCGLLFENGEQVQERLPELSVLPIESAPVVRAPVIGGKKRSTIRKRP